MNNPVTCCFGYPHKDNQNTDVVLCRRLRQDLPCLCGLARLDPPASPTGRNVYTTRTLSAWTGKRLHTCEHCMQDFDSEHSAAFHDCPGRRSPLLDADYSSLEQRVLANIDDADRSRLAYYLAGPDPWDDWKPSRDIA